MIWLIFGAIGPGFLVALLSTYAIRRKASGWGLVDHPGDRKVHRQPIPLGGGLAIWFAVVAPLAVGQGIVWMVTRGHIAADHLPWLAQTHLPGLVARSSQLWLLVGAGTVMMVVGLVDDRRGLSWQVRLAIQTMLAVALVWQGWRLTLFIDIPFVTALLSVFWIVGLTNTFNMLDNMDGQAAGVAAIVAVVLAAVLLAGPNAEAQGPQLFVAGFLLVFAGALIGFLCHNHPPARIFMGDAGSYFIGFSLAAITLAATFSGGELPRHTVLAPLCALAVPLYDTASVLLIRAREGRSLFQGDMRHFSHRLVELGLSKKHAVWTIYLATATCGLGAMVIPQLDRLGALVIVALVACVIWIIAILETAGRRKSERDSE